MPSKYKYSKLLKTNFNTKCARICIAHLSSTISKSTKSITIVFNNRLVFLKLNHHRNVKQTGEVRLNKILWEAML